MFLKDSPTNCLICLCAGPTDGRTDLLTQESELVARLVGKQHCKADGGNINSPPSLLSLSTFSPGLKRRFESLMSRWITNAACKHSTASTLQHVFSLCSSCFFHDHHGHALGHVSCVPSLSSWSVRHFTSASLKGRSIRSLEQAQGKTLNNSHVFTTICPQSWGFQKPGATAHATCENPTKHTPMRQQLRSTDLHTPRGVRTAVQQELSY